MFGAVRDLGVPYVLMHLRGNPQNMQSAHNTTYTDLIW